MHTHRLPGVTSLVAIMLSCLSLLGCGGGGGGGGAAATSNQVNDGVATVTFVYNAPTAPDTAVQNAFPSCAGDVGPTHIHLSWRGFARVNMTANGTNRWNRTFNDVPTSGLQRIRLNDANNCDIQILGATTTNIFANGVLLVNVVDTPDFLGAQPGLSFRVNEAGVVTP